MARTQWPEHAVTNGRSITVMGVFAGRRQEYLLGVDLCTNRDPSLCSSISNTFQRERRASWQTRNTESKKAK